MAETLTQFLEGSGTRKMAFETYQKLPDTDSVKRQQYLFNLSDEIGQKVGMLIYINACLVCGRSLLATDSICDRCGNMNDAYFDALSAEIDQHPIGRVMGTRGH
ncbi:MAG: hypothetical protein ACD_78C00441G0002 [uncultured bacterium (gcode 4)]|uniref:Uncharacterized protein n=1 Tax=uncultured bacterium (gcode 4) TaxID=1234023 RepID=K1XGE8_9BACT|nr:MAG: hypothetical protein ACD_78C00441G0002 [uncultured bacterium (gcode 4)]HBB27436.1 hypothetical protein [Candidatus Gracilibacteria bacterium]